MVVNPSVPAKTVSEFIAYAQANPGRISMASAGNGSTAHVTGELFKMMTSVEMVHVPYRGSAPAVTDLLGGQVQVMFDPLSSSIEYIKAGKLRALAVTTRTRWETLPEIPTVSDFVPGFDASAWQGVAAPKNMPSEIVEKLNNEINTALADPKMTARLADVGGTMLRGSYVDFCKAHRRGHREVGQSNPGGQHKEENRSRTAHRWTFHNLPFGDPNPSCPLPDLGAIRSMCGRVNLRRQFR